MSPQPRTSRQLQPEDRVTLASLKQQNCSVREIASVLGRSASTICCDCAGRTKPSTTAATPNP
jgi:IS30 family transposase